VHKRTRKATFSIFMAAVVMLMMAAVTSCEEQTGQDAAERPKPPAGVRSFAISDHGHVERPVSYPQSPPVGGPHDPVWQNCGFYDEPVRNENAVHSLEHGAVWITYQPDLPQEQVNRLRDMAHSQTYILVSPYPGLDSPVVASAWGKQLRLEGADDPRLERFVGAFRRGPQAHPGEPCSGGTGEPE
jgi:hypothetical protein